jgi:hypothetical protein
MTLKVIGSGFGRTGTASLKLALEQLGLGPCYHMMEVFKRPDAPGMWLDAADGRPDWPRIFEGFQAAVDWPTASFYRELADYYPDAKVIHTERDPDDWFDSAGNTIFRTMTHMPESQFRTMVRRVIGELFDQDMLDRDRAIAVFEAHNAQVRRTIPPERLLVYRLSEGWGPLCAFLGATEPSGPIPKVNTREEFIARRSKPPAA